jgi:hypothetical protein
MALQRMTVEYSDLPEDNGSDNRQQMLDWFVPNPQPVSDPQNLYAWIISGGANQGNNHIRYYGDCQFMYTTLAEDYGYLDDHIIVCFADGTNPAPDNSSGGNSNPDFDNDGDTDITYDATMAGVTNGYNDILGMVGPDDYLIIFTTDHGGPGKSGTDIAPEVILNLWASQTLNDDIFDGWLDTFGSATTHVVMEQCNSGGFLLETVPTTGGQPRSFASAANAYESSWAGATYPQYDEWCYWWTGAMHGSTPPGGSYPGGALPYDPDINGDSYVDYIEAFNAALAWDSYAVSGQEHPQYDDDPDTCGASYYLGGIIPVSIEDFNGLVAPGFGLSLSGNPITSNASVSFTLSQAGHVELTVFDLSGRSVTTLASGSFEAGLHTVSWDVERSPAGVYIVRLVSGDAIETVRAVRF